MFLAGVAETCPAIRAQDQKNNLRLRAVGQRITSHGEKVCPLIDVDNLLGLRLWEWTMQPATAPLSNTKDTEMFPALAKDVWTIGGLKSGGRQLVSNTLWEALQKA